VVLYTDFCDAEAPWYTNPQTLAFCDMLALENKINPPPVGLKPTSSAPSASTNRNPAPSSTERDDKLDVTTAEPLIIP
jgi:hypothetical protein